MRIRLLEDVDPGRAPAGLIKHLANNWDDELSLLALADWCEEEGDLNSAIQLRGNRFVVSYQMQNMMTGTCEEDHDEEGSFADTCSELHACHGMQPIYGSVNINNANHTRWAGPTGWALTDNAQVRRVMHIFCPGVNCTGFVAWLLFRCAGLPVQ